MDGGGGCARRSGLDALRRQALTRGPVAMRGLGLHASAQPGFHPGYECEVLLLPPSAAALIADSVVRLVITSGDSFRCSKVGFPLASAAANAGSNCSVESTVSARQPYALAKAA